MGLSMQRTEDVDETCERLHGARRMLIVRLDQIGVVAVLVVEISRVVAEPRGPCHWSGGGATAAEAGCPFWVHRGHAGHGDQRDGEHMIREGCSAVVVSLVECESERALCTFFQTKTIVGFKPTSFPGQIFKKYRARAAKK